MRALVVHIGEGSTHILLATTRRRDLLEHAGARRPNLLEGSVAGALDEDRHDRLYIIHDQQIRNGADLSLKHLGRVRYDLRESLLRQAAEALHHYRGLAEECTVALSATLLDGAVADDPLAREFQSQLGLDLHILGPQDEALWMLRGVRGIYPSGDIACVQAGHWRSLGAWEIPGRAPLLLHWEVGSTRMPDEARAMAFTGLRPPSGAPAAFGDALYITGESAWLAAALHLGLTFHDMDLLDETQLGEGELSRMEDMLEALSVEERNLIPMIGRQGDSLPSALALLRRLLKESGCAALRVCSRGVAHGLASHLFYEGRHR
jgi:hypothetical protein